MFATPHRTALVPALALVIALSGCTGSDTPDGATSDATTTTTSAAATADGDGTTGDATGTQDAATDGTSGDGQTDGGSPTDPVTVTCLSAKEASEIAGLGVDYYPDDSGWCTYEGLREVDATTMAQFDLLYGPAAPGRTAVEDGWTAEPRLGPIGQTQLADTGYSCQAMGSSVEGYASGPAGDDLCDLAVQLVLAGAEASGVQP